MKNKKYLYILIIMVLAIGGYFVSKSFAAEEHSATWNRLKVEHVTIKTRVTGTAPFNEEASNEAEGRDNNRDDDYIRTFDTIKYSVEVGIIPTDPNDTEALSLKGGVIKIRAELPNESRDGPILMRWVPDAWMLPYEFEDGSVDRTVLYAEYHVPENVSVVNAVQNLSFTIKVDGHKRALTEDMKPKFTVWMEGNKPDDAASSANAITVTDPNNLVKICGKPSYNAGLRDENYINVKGTREININGTMTEVNGQYLNMGYFIQMIQPVSGFPDLRGVEYPKLDFSSQFSVEYAYDRLGGSEGYQVIETGDSKAYNGDPLNGLVLIEAGISGDSNPSNSDPAKYWPWSRYTWALDGLPYGSGGSASNMAAVADSGKINASLNNSTQTLSINTSDYVLNGHFPDRYLSNMGYPQWGETTGYFVADVMEFFVPYYDDGNASYNYQINFKLKDMSTSNYNQTVNVHLTPDETGTVQDAYPPDNTLVKGIRNHLGGNVWAPMYATGIKYYPWTSDAAQVIDYDFVLYVHLRADDGPYEGGYDDLLVWSADFFELVEYSNNSGTYYAFDTGSLNGLHVDDPHTNFKVKYGVSKTRPSTGLSNKTEINNATYDDFNWYDTYAEAKSHGVITATFIDDPDFRGETQSRGKYFNFHIINKSSNIGKVGEFRHKPRLYPKADKSEIIYYGGEGNYDGSEVYYYTSEYNQYGQLTRNMSDYVYGESVLVLGLTSSVDTTVADKDVLGNKKTVYDVGDDVMNIVVRPTLSNGKPPRDGDKTADVTVTVVLPQGLSYNKTDAPSEIIPSVSVDNAGNTILKYVYRNWQINHDPPTSVPEIHIQAGISASLENNQELNIKSIIFTPNDLRQEDLRRTSEYSVLISNLSGAKAAKTLTTYFIEKNGSFTVNSLVGNNSEEDLTDVRALDVMPRNNDKYGSYFTGTYDVQITSIAEGQAIYYTTTPINWTYNGDSDDCTAITNVDIGAGITYDRYCKPNVRNVDFANNSAWHRVNAGDVIPASSMPTAIASTFGTVPRKSPTGSTDRNYSYKIITHNNESGETYNFIHTMTSAKLIAGVRSNVVMETVVRRKITGFVFKEDIPEGSSVGDYYYGGGDEPISNVRVKLYNSHNVLVSETLTNNGGSYEFILPNEGVYYVQFTIDENWVPITKRTDLPTGSKANTDTLRTDAIDHTYPPSSAEEIVYNVNLGVRARPAKVVTKHLLIRDNGSGGHEELASPVTDDTYWGNDYETDSAISQLPDYEFHSNAGDPTSGIVGKDYIEVIYYYDYKPAKVTVRHFEVGTSNYVTLEAMDYEYTNDVHYLSQLNITPSTHTINGSANTPQVTIPPKFVFNNVEVTGAKNVVKNGSTVTGVINSDEVVITYYYFRLTAKLNVYHYKLTRINDNTYERTTIQAPGTTNTINQTLEIDSNYDIGTSPTLQDGYSFKFVDFQVDSGTVTTLTNPHYELNTPEANKTYTFKYYYMEPMATVVSRYLNCDTGVQIANNYEEKFAYNTTYSGHLNENIANYNYKGTRYSLYPLDPDKGDNPTGTVSQADYRVDYCYKKKYTLDVRYINEVTNQLIEPATVTPYEDGDHYTTHEKTFANYVLNGIEGTDDGFFNENTVDANGVIHVVYKYLPTYSLTVKHVSCSNTSVVLHDPSVETDIPYGSQYTVSHVDDINGYHHVSPESPKQVTINGNTVVEFCYSPNDYPVTEYYIECDSKKSIHQSKTDNYTYLSTYDFNKIDIQNYTYSAVETNMPNPTYNQSIGKVTVTIPIIEENNPANVTYCYNRKESTLVVNYKDCANNILLDSDTTPGVKWGDEYASSPKVIENYVNTSYIGTPSGIIGDATVDSNNQIVVTYCYSKQSGSLTVRYLEDGSDAVVKAPYEDAREYGSSYNTTLYKDPIPNWEYVRVAGDETGTIDGNVVVTYYLRRLIGHITVHYVDEVTGEEIDTRTNRDWNLGEEYDTSPFIKAIPNYMFTNRHEGAETGTMGNPTSDVHVTYLYNKNSVELIVKYVDIDTDQEFPNSRVTDTTKQYGDHYDTTQKEFQYYHFVRVDKPTSGYIYNQLVITYYYRRNNGIVRAYYRDIETQAEIAVREDQTVPYEGHYETIQKDINKYEFVRVDGEASGTLLSDEIEVTYYYRKLRGKVITRHFDRTNNTQFGNDIIQEYKLDDHYATTSLQIDNYELVATPDNYVGVVTSTTPIIVNYYYDQLKGVVITRYLDEDTGEELLPTTRIGYNYGDRYSTIKREIDNYTWTRTDGITDGTVGENQIVVTYYYKINIGRLTVEHLEYGTNRNLAEPIVNDYPYGTDYETRREIFENYEFVSVSGTERGKIYGNVVVRYYYRLKDAKITINYLDERDHSVHLKDTEVYNVKWGDNYLFNSVRIENFDYVRTDGDPERGTVDGNKVINYYYNRRQANLVVHHLESGTERILANEDREIVYYGLNYSTRSKDIDGYKVDASLRPDNAYGVVDGDIDVTYYYDRKDAEVITTYIDRATGNPLLSPDIVGYNYGDTYTTIAREIPNYELVDRDGAATGKVTKDLTEVIYYYDRLVGNVTIKYLDETNLEELYPTINKQINYGDDYSSEEKEFEGYELTRIEGTPNGIVDGDKIIIYYYNKKDMTLIVKYLEVLTNDELHSPTVTTHKYGDSYQTVELSIKDYDFVMVDGVTNGTITNNPTTVIYYYERHKANIIARYIEEGTNKEIAPPQTQEVGLGKYYVTSSSGAVPPNYELVRKTDNYEGIARQDEIEVFYYYRKVDSDLITHISKVGIEEISSRDDFVDYEINYEAKLTDYIGTATVTITDKLPYQIDINQSNLDGGTYNQYKNTIEWTIVYDDDDLDNEHGSIDTYSGDDTIMITKYVSLKYIGYEATERSMVNTVTGKIKLSNNQKEVSDNLVTRISIPGTIIVHHYLVGTTEELAPDEYNEGLVGETYISSPQEFEGYRVVTRPTNETFVFGENEQDVIYEYERIKFNLDVEVVGGVGDATGAEEIFYGDDSTPDNIVITPGEGYEIERIVINGVSYEVDNRDGMTLDNFINVQENIKVEVEFVEKPMDIPITGMSSKLIVIAVILIVFTILYVSNKIGLLAKLLKR